MSAGLFKIEEEKLKNRAQDEALIRSDALDGIYESNISRLKKRRLGQLVDDGFEWYHGIIAGGGLSLTTGLKQFKPYNEALKNQVKHSKQ